MLTDTMRKIIVAPLTPSMLLERRFMNCTLNVSFA